MRFGRVAIAFSTGLVIAAIAGAVIYRPGRSPEAIPGQPVPFAIDSAGRDDGRILSAQALVSKTAAADIYRIRYRSDGLAVLGYAIVPHGADRGLPVVLFAHGGSGADAKIGTPVLDYLAQISVKGRYVILATDYRGTPGSEGRDAYGGSDVDDVVNMLPVARDIDRANPQKLLTLGFSRGGLETYAVIKKGIPLMAAAVVSAPVDLAATYNRSPPLTQWTISHAIGGTPAAQPQAYAARSPVAWPERITVPTLILHGDADRKVAADDVRRFAARLTALGKPHRLVVVPGGNHMLFNAADQRDREIISWFATQTRP